MSDVKAKAVEKLKKELPSTQERYAKIIIGQLIKRCEEDSGIAEDVLQEHKTWSKCYDYIVSQASKRKKGNCAIVDDATVFEWAEDYYHRDDKAEAKAAAVKSKTEKGGKKKQADVSEKPKKEVKAKKPKKVKEKTTKEIEGQLSLFDMM